MKGPYKLKLTKLEFLSAVDSPAQGKGAQALLFKSRGRRQLTARVAKTSDELGLVFGYAFSSSLDGGQTPHVDYQDDAIDADFLKTAMDFVEGGGATDVNHDGAQDGRIIFAWPLIPEVNKALGIDAKTVGLAVAIKPSAETYKRFKSGELTGFSIQGLGERTALSKRAVRKEAVLTSVEAGHQHSLDIDAPADAWCDSYATSCQTSEGATAPHSHAWTFDATTGEITIGADSGHTHSVAAMVPADALIAYAALDAAEDASNLAAIPEPITDEPSSGKTISVVIASRTPQAISTPEQTLITVKSQPEPIAMSTAQENQTADEVVYTSKSTGETFRKSEDPRLVIMAKRQDEQAAEIAKRDEAIEKALVRGIAKSTLGNLAGDDSTHDLIVSALRKSGAPQADIDKALAAMTGWNALGESATVAKGVTGGEPKVESPLDQWNALVTKTAADKNVSFSKAAELAADTEEGRRIYSDMYPRK